jgi:hypothetical protein
MSTPQAAAELTNRHQDNHKGDKNSADDYCELEVAELSIIGVIYDYQHP